MTLVSLKAENTRREGVFKAEFSGGPSLLFAADYLPEREAAVLLENAAKNSVTEYAGTELSGGEEEAFRFAAACYKAEKSALRLIARAEQNSLGLAAKLERRGYPAAAVKAVVFYLSGRNLLDDRRYAERWICSPRRLLSSLCARGIDRDDAQAGLKAALDGETEYCLLRRYVNKLEKLKSFRKAQSEDRPAYSLKYVLKTEGFSPPAIQEFFEQDTDEQEIEP